MNRQAFVEDWTFSRDGGAPEHVRLPHDAMLAEPRSPEASTGNHGGYFPGGRYRYSRRWVAPADASDRRYSLFFEGVHGATRVLLDGVDVGGCNNGYREFAVPLDAVVPGAESLIEVLVDNSATPNSRWYTGSGIYRRVWLQDVLATHIGEDGIRVRTRSFQDPAIVDVDVLVENAPGRKLTAVVDLLGAAQEVSASTAVAADGSASLTLEVPQPQLWSHESPDLYVVRVRICAGEEVVDQREVSVGLRTVAVDARHGLTVNGRTTLLRGACVHHDSGVLGAATFRAAEFRRVRVLKENGFNAIRSSHNPLSRDMLDACDRYGLYVLDELTDVWYQPKTAHDDSARFDQEWMDDARSLIAKDRNHACVIMYSIGNEVAETASHRGVEVTRQLSDFFRQEDPARPTTVAVNFLLNVMASFGRSPFSAAVEAPARAPGKQSAVTSTAVNVVANRLGAIMQAVARLPRADRYSRDALAAVDVAGYNYAWGRYRGDARRHPDRVVLGTESLPGDIARIWRLVERLPNVIGDFLWTGWDYLGEAGIGTWSYGSDATAAVAKDYPNLVAGCGLIDITGLPGAGTYLVRAVWGQLPTPEIAVRPLDRSGEVVRRTAWRSTDSVPSWAWRGHDGRAAEIEVYCADEEVELLLDGRSLGRRPSGAEHGHVARFTTAYAPGELTAVAYRGGVETARSTLRSAGRTRLQIVSESDSLDADGEDLAFLHLQLGDEAGVVEMAVEDSITVEVSGSGSLIGLGSGAPAPEEPFTSSTHSTWRGRAFAVVRAGTETGTVTIRATSERHGDATLEILVRRTSGTTAETTG